MHFPRQALICALICAGICLNAAGDSSDEQAIRDVFTRFPELESARHAWLRRIVHRRR